MAVTPSFRLSTREQRKKLAARDQPYYVELRRGLALGYRRGKTGSSWLMRESRGDHFVKRRLGAADDTVSADGAAVLSWPQAQAMALGSERPTLTQPRKISVGEAAERYFATRQRDTTHDTFTWAKFIQPDFGNKGVSELTTGDLLDWLAKQAGTHTDPAKRRAAQATANRRWTLLRAILNSAYKRDPERVPSADAWRRVAPYQNVDQPRTRFLEATEAVRLIKALQRPVRDMAQAALYTGCRLGELEALQVQDVTEGHLFVRPGKTGKSRYVNLNAEGAEFFRDLCGGRNRGESMFPRLYRLAIGRAMKAACASAKISPPVVFHDLRRSHGSLLLNAGASMEVIQKQLGHADARMTQRVYAHLTDKTKAQAIEEFLPSFGGKVRAKRGKSPTRA